jgi:membrane-associated phospholipid phosphatase
MGPIGRHPSSSVVTARMSTSPSDSLIVQTRLRVALAGAGMCSLSLFIALTVEVTLDQRPAWDRYVLRHLDGTIPGAIEIVWLLVIAFPALALVMVVVLLRNGRVHSAVFVSLAVGGALLLDPMLKGAIRRPPVNVGSSDYSFPSGSAMVAVATVVAVTSILPRSRRSVAAFAGAVVVVAQGGVIVSVGWHFPSDVVAGWCVSVVWVSVAWGLVAACVRLGIASPARRS